jgi:hypothetical protein
VRELEAAGGSDLVDLNKQIARLTEENAAMTTRLASAAERTEGLLDRVRFTRQQQESAGETR